MSHHLRLALIDKIDGQNVTTNTQYVGEIFKVNNARLVKYTQPK